MLLSGQMEGENNLNFEECIKQESEKELRITCTELSSRQSSTLQAHGRTSVPSSRSSKSTVRRC
jgi:hypothetical protein